MTIWPIRILVLLTLAFAMVLTDLAGVEADNDRTFGPKPWIGAPSPKAQTPLQKHRASVYRMKLNRETRQLDMKRPLTNTNSISRFNSYRREQLRLNRAPLRQRR